MAFKLTKREEQRRASLINRLSEAQRHYHWCVRQIEGYVREANKALDRHLAASAAVREYAASVAARLREQFDRKADSWQDGEDGEDARTMIDQWAGLATTGILVAPIPLPLPRTAQGVTEDLADRLDDVTTEV